MDKLLQEEPFGKSNSWLARNNRDQRGGGIRDSNPISSG